MWKKAFTQFERACQASDDSDWVRGVCAELVKWGKESIPLVLKLETKQEVKSRHILDIY